MLDDVIIVQLIHVVVMLCVYQPAARIDQRLAGRWECKTPTPGRQAVTLYLRGDGRGHYAWQEGSESFVRGYPWGVSGQRLQINFPGPIEAMQRSGRLMSLQSFLDHARSRRIVLKRSESWTLIQVEKNQLIMLQNSTGQLQVFRRVASALDSDRSHATASLTGV